MNKRNALISFFCLFLFSALAQEEQEGGGILIDRVVAVVGNRMIKFSDVENQASGMRLQVPDKNSEDLRCEVLEQLLVSSLFELQAEEDSIMIGDAEVESELDARIRYFVEQIGSKEKLEEFYQKSILEIKEENREMIKNTMLSGRMQQKITEEVRVTPSEVKRYYGSLHRDSVPLIPTQYELGVIVKNPKINKAEINEAKMKIEDLRLRIENGERFEALAALYSEDPGSSRRGGDVGFGGRGDWAPEFESMAFGLQIGELSPVIETNFGFHILEVSEKKGDQVKVRHVLIRPKASALDMMIAQKELDSVSSLIREGEVDFNQAVKWFSDEAGRQADGVYLSPMTRKPVYGAEEIEPSVFFTIENLKNGDVTNALSYQDETGNTAFRIFYVIRKSSPHKANLTEDYDRIYQMALNEAREERMSSWMRNKISQTYIHLMGNYENCKFNHPWKL